MSPLLVIVVLVAVLISSLGTVAAYYAIWQGGLKPLRRQWSEWDAATRRRVLVADVWVAVFIAIGVAVVIVEPFGRYTIAYLMGGIGLIFVIGIPIWAGVMAWRNARDKQ